MFFALEDCRVIRQSDSHHRCEHAANGRNTFLWQCSFGGRSASRLCASLLRVNSGIQVSRSFALEEWTCARLAWLGIPDDIVTTTMGRDARSHWQAALSLPSLPPHTLSTRAKMTFTMTLFVSAVAALAAVASAGPMACPNIPTNDTVDVTACKQLARG